MAPARRNVVRVEPVASNRAAELIGVGRYQLVGRAVVPEDIAVEVVERAVLVDAEGVDGEAEARRRERIVEQSRVEEADGLAGLLDDPGGRIAKAVDPVEVRVATGLEHYGLPGRCLV